MKSLHTLFALALAVALFPGCAGTKPVAEWKDPNATQQLKKIAVGVATTDPGRRRVAEDTVVQRLPPGSAVASYTFIPPGSERDVELVKKLIAEQGADGALIVQVAGVDQKARVTSAPVPATAYGYWGYAYTTMYTPSTVEISTTVHVDSRLYAIEGERLLWTLSTDTEDPSNAQQARSEVADVVVSHLLNTKLLAAAPAK